MKLDQLKAAYEAATPGQWDVIGDTDVVTGIKFVASTLYPDSEVGVQIEHDNANFIALAHNMMPLLLEAVELLEKLSACSSSQSLKDKAWTLLDELQ